MFQRIGAFVVVFLIAIIAAPPASAASTFWRALQVEALRYEVAGDVITDSEHPFDREWTLALFRDNDGTAEWPGTIQTRTTLDPTFLQVHPNATSFDPATATYEWATTTNGPQTVIDTTHYPQLIAPGLSVERNLYGGREVVAGSSVRRTFTIVLTATQTFPDVQVSVGLGTTAGQPVTTSEITCAPAPASVGGSTYSWFIYPLAAGTPTSIRCDLTLSNAGTSTASFMPRVFVNAAVQRDISSAYPAGTNTWTTSSVLGDTTFTVRPPIGTTPTLMSNSMRSRYLTLSGQNALLPPPPPSAAWWAQVTQELTNSFESGDTITNAPRDFTPAYRFMTQSPGWPSTTTVATTIPAASLQAFPAVTPSISGGVATYTWSGAGFLASSLVDQRRVSATPGLSVSRTQDGGRVIAAHATVTRPFHVTIAVAEPLASVEVTITFQPSFSPPGSPPLPVTAANVSCPTGTPHPTNPGLVNWSLPGAAGSVSDLSCTADLTNTSDVDARYIPAVEVYAFGPWSSEAATANSFAFDDPAVGHVTMGVTPPAGVLANGTLGRGNLRRVTLEQENSVSVQEWSATLSRVFTTDTTADAVGNGVPLRPSWGFTIQAHPSSLGAHIRATTALSASNLMPYPAVTPTTMPDGSHEYAWNGSTPFFTSTLGSNGITIASPLGFDAERSVTGARFIAAHSSSTRTLTVNVRVIDPMIRLTAVVNLFPFTPSGATPLPVTVTAYDCPGSSASPGLDGSRSWYVDTPAAGTTMTLTCTFTTSNTGADDVTFVPSVFFWSSRSFVSAAAVTSAQLHLTTDLLGSIDFSIDPPAGTTARGISSEIDIRIATLLQDLRVRPRPTQLELLTTGSYAFGFVPSLEARLTAAEGGAPLGGKPLTIQVRNSAGAITATLAATTDGAGRVSVTLPTQPLPDSYTLRATFAGDAGDLASSVEAPLTVVNSVARVVGGVRLGDGGLATLALQSTSGRLTGELEFRRGDLAYHATVVRALGVSPDGHRAAILVADGAGVVARVIITDDAIDRLSIRVAGVDYNADGEVIAGNIQIIR